MFRSKLRSEVRRLTAPWAVHRSPLAGATFEFEGRRLPYGLYEHNYTWVNERAVEIPIALDFLRGRGGRGLEFGNVLTRYGGNVGQLVVDKFEVAQGVLNVDILEYEPNGRFDYIVSVSTLEHVGWDERPRDERKVLAAFHHLRTLLAPDGQMLITAPTGHNPALDEAIRTGALPGRQTTIVRTDDGWNQTEDLEIHPYLKSRGRGADCVWVVLVGAAVD